MLDIPVPINHGNESVNPRETTFPTYKIATHRVTAWERRHKPPNDPKQKQIAGNLVTITDDSLIEVFLQKMWWPQAKRLRSKGQDKANFTSFWFVNCGADGMKLQKFTTRRSSLSVCFQFRKNYCRQNLRSNFVKVSHLLHRAATSDHQLRKFKPNSDGT